MKKTYCDKCGKEMEFNPNWGSDNKEQKGFSFLDIYVDIGNPLRAFRIGALPSVRHTTDICKDCWQGIKAKIVRGEFTLSVNHTLIYRETTTEPHA